MNDPTNTLVTIVLSAFVGAITSLGSERLKLRHRLRVENEYQILKSIWNKAYWLKSRACNLRPVDDLPPVDELPEDRKKRRLSEFETAVASLKEEMCLNKPFYPREIYELLNKLRVATEVEAAEFGRTRMNSKESESYGNSAKHVKDINNTIELLCEAVRSKIYR